MDIFAPLQWLADWLIYSAFSIQSGTQLADSVNFFIYDSLKILLLLIFINYIMAIARHYLPVEKIRAFLTSRKWYGADYLLAATFGAITPFCSCSSIPFFVGFLGAGIPIGVTFSFLITSPLVNEAAVILLAGLFGWKLTLTYVVSGMAIGVIGGTVLSRVNVQKHINKDILDLSKNVNLGNEPAIQKFNRGLWLTWWREAYEFTKKLMPYILIGVGLGAVIHGFVPQNFFEATLGSNAWWTVPVAVIVAAPLYSNAVGVVPIVQAFVAKGVAIGTSFAFMMATVGLSLPEALILKKVMSLKLLVAYFGVVTLGIIVIGYLLNIFF
ncbi:permease [Candidatus Saccharibacteria bacterium]|nr:permease [Candidatus Saccharibacteria bacterium]NCU40532.1 permease [Candidatus Saccharibacteria bacterium]